MRRLAHTEIPVAALTHPGMKGKNNEDCFGVSSFALGPLGPWPVLLAVLSDGIGGHRAGEVAAQLAVEQVSRSVGRSDGGDPPRILTAAVQAASEAIFRRAQVSPLQSGMGATCACVWIIGRRLYTAAVGDSRIYLLRQGQIRRLSTDHTWVQEALDKGLLKPEQINGHPNQHVIRRYLGGPTPPEVDLRLRLEDGEDDRQAEANQGAALQPGDLVLLTSDGLTDLVNDEEILAAFQTGRPLAETGRELIDLANRRGGHDNITLVSIAIPPSPPDFSTRLRHAGLRLWSAILGLWPWALGGCAGLALVLVLALGLAGGWWSVRGTGTSSPPTPVPTALPAAQATPLPSPSPQPTARLQPPDAFLTPTATPALLLPAETGPTLTPWPTNTP